MRGFDSNANKLRFHNHNAHALGDDHGVTQALAKAAITGTTYPSQEVVWKAPLYRTAQYAETECATVAFGG